jgi:ATP adenylyltransferase
MDDYSDYNARNKGTYGDIWTQTGKCVFCDLREKYLITTNDKAVLTVNLFPYIDGHLMVIPKRHVESFEEITEEEWTDMQRLAKIGVRLLKEVLNIENVWILQRAPKGTKASKSVPHTHMFILPHTDGLNKWTYQEITIPPVELAEKLRKKL